MHPSTKKPYYKRYYISAKLLEDCHDERADDDCDDSDEPLTLSPRTDWLAIAADITGAAK